MGIILISPDTLVLRLVNEDKWIMLFWRNLLPSIVLIGFALYIHKQKIFSEIRYNFHLGIASALLFAVSSICFVTAVTLTSVANTLVIVSSSPLFAAAWSYCLMREKLPARTWITIAVAAAAILIIVQGSSGSSSLSGDLIALCAACLLAGHLSVVRMAGNKDMVPFVALSGLLVAIAAWWATPDAASLWLELETNDWWLMLGLGIILLPLSYVLLTLAPRYVASAEVSLIILLEAVLGPLFVWWALDEIPNVFTFIGGVILLGTMVIYSLLTLRATQRFVIDPK